jgi:hypothetical protein
VAIIILNKTENAIDFNLWMNGQAGLLSIPGHAIMTCVIP